MRPSKTIPTHLKPLKIRLYSSDTNKRHAEIQAGQHTFAFSDTHTHSSEKYDPDKLVRVREHMVNIELLLGETFPFTWQGEYETYDSNNIPANIKRVIDYMLSHIQDASWHTPDSNQDPELFHSTQPRP